MKAREFSQKLLDFADKMRAESDSRHAAALRSLSRLFENSGDRSVAVLLKGSRPESLSRARAGGPTVKEANAALDRFRRALSAKDRRSATKDFTSLTELLSGNDSASIANLVASVAQSASRAQPRGKRKLPVNQALVDDFLKRLEESLGDPQAFKVVFEELEGHPEIGQPEAVALARAFMGKTASTATRKAALERVLSRHSALMDFRAKRKAFGGRTAA